MGEEATRPTPRWVRLAAGAGAASVLAYVAAWVGAGVWRAGYDPLSQSISELYAQQAPAGPATLLIVTLAVSGLLFVPFAAALHRVLPGESLTAPVVAALGGIATALLATVPCTPGCPGLGASLQDNMHVAIAAVAYACLVGAPVLFAVRLRGHNDWFAAASLVLGLVPAVGLGLRALGVGVALTGLSQRIFNTIADLWYVLAGVLVVARTRPERTSTRPGVRAVSGRR